MPIKELLVDLDPDHQKEEVRAKRRVLNKVLQDAKIPGEPPLVKALTAILTASQRYMRHQTVRQPF